MTQLVQILLTSEQAALLSAAADVTVRAHEEGTLVELKDDEKTSLEQLVIFMGMVATDPSKFPVTGKLAASIKSRSRELRKGAAEQPSRKNARKERQERRMRTHKARRKTRREDAANYNGARAQMEAEVAEMQAIQDERMAQIEAEPKFTVTDIMGSVLIDNVPQSMIVPVVVEDEEYVPVTEFDSEEYNRPHEYTAPKVIMPGSAEALGITLTSDETALD